MEDVDVVVAVVDVVGYANGSVVGGSCASVEDVVDEALVEIVVAGVDALGCVVSLTEIVFPSAPCSTHPEKSRTNKTSPVNGSAFKSIDLSRNICF